MRYIIYIFAFVATLSSCSDNKGADVSDISIDTKLVRFDSLFYNSDARSLSNLKSIYPLMFPEEYADSLWMNKINDSTEQAVYEKSVKIFGDFKKEYEEIVDVFKRMKFYFPKFDGVDVYTIISDFDYEYPVLYSRDRLFVSLDMYLGADEEEYSGFPAYLSSNFIPERIKVDVAKSIVTPIVARDRFDKTLIAKMIYNGKLLYLEQKLLPTTDEFLIIGYSKDQIEWCKTNEREIWTYIVKKKYLYNSDPKLKTRFIDLAPFTKFFLELDRESPGRVGEWLGWQIVNSYMVNNDVTIEELAAKEDFQDIFKNSKYKPRK
ncbi:MAG: gliding motility lipoprotein GldB [Flavobacteriales bacterium]|nr:gliding motility lipoprotein GldB [Flavobacteriales bacterium]